MHDGADHDATPTFVKTGLVKWFDPGKGFGFVVVEGQDHDVLLHANVLRNFGQSSIAEGATITFEGQLTERGAQATKIISVEAPDDGEFESHPEIDGLTKEDIEAIEFEPGRVKWFDKSKGFGFANIFGSTDDVFIHIEVLRRSSFSEVEPGEAVAIKLYKGDRGLLAVQIASWDAVVEQH